MTYFIGYCGTVGICTDDGADVISCFFPFYVDVYIRNKKADKVLW